jgi:hypothetical protein
MTAVVRVGDTVRRGAGPWTATIHAFMRHLRASGFEAVPEPLGIDDRGPESISLLPGARDWACTSGAYWAIASVPVAVRSKPMPFASSLL